MKLKKYMKEASEVEFERAMQGFADLVGRGGRLSHKPTADFLAKAYGYKESKQDLNIRKIMDDLEDWNYHTEYSILEALMDGRKNDANILVQIAQEHLKIGSMPYDLSSLRSYISDRKRFEKNVKMGLGISGKGAPIKFAEKIFKSMDKRDVVKFLELFQGGE